MRFPTAGLLLALPPVLLACEAAQFGLEPGLGAAGPGTPPREPASPQPPQTPQTDARDEAMQLAAGLEHSCALMASGEVRCWGRNNRGQLGLGDTEDRGDEIEEMGAALPAVPLAGKALAIAAGHHHSCALLEDGRVQCWGQNSSGQLGIADREDRGDEPGEMGQSLPAVDLGQAATDLVAGGDSSCAILEDGGLMCWGDNSDHQLGVQAPGSTATPLQLELGAPVLSVDLHQHGCALLVGGALKCWGDNTSGKLGLGLPGGQVPSASAELPSVDLGAQPIRQVRVGAITSLARVGEGALKWWGEVNMRVGQEAVGDQPNEMGERLRPLDFGAVQVLDMDLEADNPCALLETQEIKCWGFHNSGIPGPVEHTVHGSRLRTHPAIALRGPAIAVAVGGQHACALLEDRSVQCWGEDRHGALGRSGTEEGPLPTVDLSGPALKKN